MSFPNEFVEPFQLGNPVQFVELVVTKGKVKLNTNIERGQLVCNDGAGFVPATAALAATQTVFVAGEKHVYAEAEAKEMPDEEKHMIALNAKGVVVAMKDTGTAIVQGQKLKVGTTGKATLAAASTDVVIGSAAENAASADDRVIIRIGQ